MLAGAILSITLNPVVFVAADNLRKRRLEREAAKAAPVIPHPQSFPKSQRGHVTSQKPIT